MDIHNYAFIDGNYLRRAYEDTMRKCFADVSGSNINHLAIKTSLSASKVFYYDSVDDDKDDAETRKTSLAAISALTFKAKTSGCDLDLASAPH